MTKITHLMLIAFFMYTANLFAENVTYSWSFTTSLAGTASNSQSLADATFGSTIGGTAYGYTFGTVAGWTRVATSPNLPYSSYDANSYIQVVVTPPTATKLSVNSITANLLGGGTGSVRIAAYYSTDNFATTPGTNLGNATYNGTAGKVTTSDVGLNIISNSNATAALQGLMEFAPNITVNAGQSLYIRFYAWAGSAGRYLTVRNIVINGTTEAVQNIINLTTSVSPANAGTVIPASGSIEGGKELTLSATRAFGYKFKEWRGAKSNQLISSSNPATITPTTDTAVVAVFEPIPTYTFDVTKAGDGATWGKVTLSPAPTNGKYEEGTMVSMTAVPNRVVNFLHWEDNSTEVARSITVNENKTFTATFDEIPFIVGWNFTTSSSTTDIGADYYASTDNTGLFTVRNADGTSVGGLYRLSAFSPAYSCIHFWHPAANFATPRYFETTFSTVGYKNIQVKSMLSGSYHAYPVMTMLYSVDGINYTELGRVDITSAYNSTWANLDATLPSEAQGKSKIYIRWIADVTSTPLLGNATDVDGTAIANIFVYADKDTASDPTPPQLVSTVPAENSSNASANGSIIFTFDERVKAGTGNCTLGSSTLTPVFGAKTVSFAYTRLAYNTDYTFTIPSGAITDMNGNAYTGSVLHFRTMDKPKPTARMFDAVIAKDGSGDYTTVQGAIDAAPVGRTIPWLIFVKNGTYVEHVDLPSNKTALHFIGQQRDSVIISYDRKSGTGDYPVDPGASVVIKGSDCYFENITFENSYGYLVQNGPQALAVYTNTARVTFKNCWMRSYQDTYLTGSAMANKGYLQNCKIQGAVDFIYGQGDFYFDKCTITCTRPSGGYIVAPNHAVGTAWGYVFKECTLDAPEGMSVTTYLGRPWHDAPKTSFINTISKINIYPVGWYYKMGAIPAIFADYNTMDANGNPIDLSQRIEDYEYDVKDANGVVTSIVKGKAKKSFTDAEAATYTYENVIIGNGTWDPRTKTETTDAPENVVLAGNTLSWKADNYAICYVIIKNNKVIGFSTSASYTDVNYTTDATYKVIAAAESGALSQATTATVSTATENIRESVKPYYTIFGNQVNVYNIIPGSYINMYSVTGAMLESKYVNNTSCSFLYNGPAILKIKSASGISILKLTR